MAQVKNGCERECNCSIEIEESLVLIFCGDIDVAANGPKKKFFGREQKDGEPEVENKIGFGNNEACGCEIEIEESLVVVVCGEIDADKMKSCLQAYEEFKGNKKSD
ncbi:hypothetical protein SPSYN_01089 [Sporotomaculum syntrophicum]|uniref:Uncharacterized protein n=1 Tax=Sporotomaculum syntrophicum TaxID=182264 RepID=A0A9D2WPG7_9FIRM|nr:hypothetical protein [Sporotomaculum syntrophicum]KAF1084953.1 hypothetical protein SPSYN_01089 [Sporotomaculum syntrophicum]